MIDLALIIAGSVLIWFVFVVIGGLLVHDFATDICITDEGVQQAQGLYVTLVLGITLILIGAAL